MGLLLIYFAGAVVGWVVFVKALYSHMLSQWPSHWDREDDVLASIAAVVLGLAWPITLPLAALAFAGRQALDLVLPKDRHTS